MVDIEALMREQRLPTKSMVKQVTESQRNRINDLNEFIRGTYDEEAGKVIYGAIVTNLIASLLI